LLYASCLKPARAAVLGVDESIALRKLLMLSHWGIPRRAPPSEPCRPSLPISVITVIGGLLMPAPRAQSLEAR
jgi:hypothetical protein